MKICIACGMPMNNKEDHAQKNESLEYCRFCAREDGSMQSYEEKLDILTSFIVSSQGIHKDNAKKLALEKMSLLPAWQKTI